MAIDTRLQFLNGLDFFKIKKTFFALSTEFRSLDYDWGVDRLTKNS